MKHVIQSFLLTVSILMLSACGRPPGLGDSGGDIHTAKELSVFATLKTNVFDSKCAKCHSPPKPKGGIDLTSYEKIVDSSLFPPLVIPGDPEHSSLYTVCASGKMPKRSPPLTSIELQGIYNWIKDGARKDDQTAPPSAPSGEPGAGTLDRGEPCDVTSGMGEPGVSLCTNEPGDY